MGVIELRVCVCFVATANCTGLYIRLTKLPRVEILNMDNSGEVELQTTYYDALLSELIVDQDKNVALRWPSKSIDEEQTDIRPDALVSTIMQHYFGYPVSII